MDMVKRFEVYFIDFNPTIGSEINKIRQFLRITQSTNNHLSNR